MATEDTGTQEESRSETLTMRLTPSEKTAVVGVAAARGVKESNLLRDMTLSQVMEVFERIKAAA